jgi:hypothetical protein
MAQKFLKVIQDGLTSYVPDTKFAREFWAKQNARLGKNRNAQHEIATIMPASEEEVEFMTKPVAESSVSDSIKSILPSDDRLAKLQSQLESQQALINTLMGKLIDAQPQATEVKGKPGPKPKTDNDGKDETKADAKA